MKYVSPHRDQLYSDALGETLLPSRRLMNTVSPQRIMQLQDLASGPPNLVTSPRSRLDSQESRLGVFASLKCEESLLPVKADPHFQSPNPRGRLGSQIDGQLFTMGAGLALNTTRQPQN